MYARRLSTGLHCGKRLSAAPPIASCAPVPSGATNQIAQRPVAFRSNAIVEPSCDQLGFTFAPGPSNATRGAEPSTGTTSIAEPAALAVEIATAAPSGDHTGPVTSPLGGATPRASCRTPLPDASDTASASP